MSDTVMNVNEMEIAWRGERCQSCLFAIQRTKRIRPPYVGAAGIAATYECRHSPPNVKGDYPVVTEFTPACGQFKEEV